MDLAGMVKASASSTLAQHHVGTSLPDWLSWQESLHGRSMELGLDRCRIVAARLGLEQPRYTVVSIAGTNGKGSSVAMLDAVLRAAGYRVGTYTSPHLLRYNERIRINDDAVDDASLCDAFQRIEDARGDITLTYFEFGTLAALDLFSRGDLDIGLLEVGLGGRLDAVNLVDADIALITTIGLDHVEWLGSDRNAIGREKAGIFRSGQTAICSDPCPPSSISQTAKAQCVKLYQLGRDFDCEPSETGWVWSRGRGQRIELKRPNLVGRHQIQNAAGVAMVISALDVRHPVARGALDAGLSSVELAGRFQVIPGEPELVLDVAHNAQAAKCLARNLADYPSRGRTHVIVGMLNDKDFNSVLNELASVADSWHLVNLNSDRAASASRLHRALEDIEARTPVRRYPDPGTAYDWVRRVVAGERDRILVYGSFLTVSEVVRRVAAAQ